MKSESINGRTYMSTTELENWRYRQQMLKDGFGRVEYPHPKGKIIRFIPLKRCREVGIDEFNGETLPRYEEF